MSQGASFRMPIAAGLTVCAALFLMILGSTPAMAAAPANDDFANAQTLTGTSIAVQGNVADSTFEIGEPAASFGNLFTGTVWFRWTAPVTGPIKLESPHVGLGVYTGNAVNSLSLIAQNLSMVEFSAEQGQVYRIAVAKPSENFVSSFVLDLRAVTSPQNDSFSGAKVISGANASFEGDNRGATHEAGEPNHFGQNGNASVWYSWNAPSTGTSVINVCYTNIRAVAVYTGSSVGSLTEIAAGTCRIKVPTTSGTNYRIALDTNSDRVGPFDFLLRPSNPPPNDDFSNAELLTGAEVSVTRPVVDSTMEPGEPNYGTQTGSVWFTWTAPESGQARIKASFPMVLGVYRGTQINSLMSDYNGGETYHFHVVEGTNYKISVGEWNGYLTENFTLDLGVYQPPPNDDFESAETLVGGTASTSGDLRGATGQAGEPNHAEGGNTVTVWYSWTATQSGSTVIDACEVQSVVRGLVVYTGATLNGLTPVQGSQCQVIINAVSGTTYRIALASTLDRSRQFTLRVKPFQIPPNDNFANAQTIVGSSASGNLSGATMQPNEPLEIMAPGYFAGSVWYRWVAPSTGMAELVAPAYLRVYTGTELGNLADAGGEGNGQSSFDAVAGTTYWILVGMQTPFVSSFPLTIEMYDTTPPETTIDSGPSGTITVDHATFTFHGTPGDTAKIQCRLDAEIYEDCSSPKTWTGLSEGLHTVRFQARDDRENRDPTPALRSFVVDRTGPSISVSSGPTGSTNEPAVTFGFLADEAGVTFECSIDGAIFEACSSPATFDVPDEGEHEFAVRGSDPYGNQSAQDATRTWTLNPAVTSTTTSGSVPAGGAVSTDPAGTGPSPAKPATASIAVPAGGDVEVVQEPASTEDPTGFTVFGQQFKITAPTATVAAPLVLTFRIDASAIPAETPLHLLTLLRDGEPAGECSGTPGSATPDPCVDDRTVLDDDDVVLTVLSSHASDWNFAIADPPPPDTTPPDTTIDSGPAAIINIDQATFAFHGTVGDTAKIQCSLDGSVYADCTSPQTFAALAEGAHTVSIRAEDAAGNQDPSPATGSFTVKTTIDGPSPGCLAATSRLKAANSALKSARAKVTPASKGVAKAKKLLAKARKARKKVRKSKVKKAKKALSKAKSKLTAANKVVAKAKQSVTRATSEVKTAC